MDLEAEDQPQPDEPRVPADESYQRLAGHNDANPPLQNDGRYDKLHICLIILIAVMFAVFLACNGTWFWSCTKHLSFACKLCSSNPKLSPGHHKLSLLEESYHRN